uniref:ATP synthase F0 subunit 8 n=1 Tax=Megacrania alpheus adan TaxID=590997 RepID=E2RV51_9NEOP|nr:ATP synthase F0 subunit 8 [Megacrania alpheus adan]BAJ24585.1 ATP synthase F0 subunit 8 [Megacrania alpheus adan]
MPQMAPMSWMIMYMYIMTTLMMFMTKIYFTKKMKINKNINMMEMNKENNWKW